MLKELIRDKIQEIFLVYQKENNIISGDIYPTDALELNQIEESLCELIERVGDYQPRGYSAHYTYVTKEGNTYTKEFARTRMDEFFSEVSNIIAFGDCTHFEVTNIYFDGMEIEYVGWQPNMIYTYKDPDGEIIWSGQFIEWEH